MARPFLSAFLRNPSPGPVLNDVCVRVSHSVVSDSLRPPGLKPWDSREARTE